MMTPLVYTQHDDICWEGSQRMAEYGLVHGVTQRTGGVSKGLYESLNLALHTGDDVRSVLENRRRLCETAKMSFHRLTGCQQTHEDRIELVTAAFAGRGHDVYDDGFARTDALMTNCHGVPLLICIADCVPIILYDPVGPAVAVVHAGWRGTVQKLAAKTVLHMQKQFGSDPAQVLAYIGPSIGAKDFSVGAEVVQVFEDAFGGDIAELLTVRNNNYFINLAVANTVQLEAVGVRLDHIAVTATNVCDDNSGYFSYRRDCGQTGRMAAFAMIPE